MYRALVWGLGCALLAFPAAAGGGVTDVPKGGGLIYDVKIGAQAHDVPYLWSGFHKEPYSVDLNLEVMFSPSVRLLGGDIRPALGATINFEGYTSKAYLDARWQWECSYHTFIAVGLGLAYHNGNDESFVWDPDHKMLGRRVLFHDVVEAGYRLDDRNSVSLFFEHISNASTAHKNQGLDTLGLRYGYRF
jgi:hypothetical protein